MLEIALIVIGIVILILFTVFIFFDFADFLDSSPTPSTDYLISVKELKSLGQSEKEQRWAWRQITKKIRKAERQGRRYAVINSSIYSHIPMDIFEATLRKKGYILEGSWQKYYNKGLLIEIRWGNRDDSKSYEHF